MPAINNFGYLWDRDRVFWGYPGVEGTLLGRCAKFDRVDFRKQRGVYVLHSDSLAVVYVGQVGSGRQTLFGRLKSHTRSKELWNRWRYFSWFGWRKVNQNNLRLANYGKGSPKISGTTSEFLDEIEAVLLQVVEPRLNRQGPRWRGALQFEQLDDDRLERSDLPTMAMRLARIEKSFKNN